MAASARSIAPRSGSSGPEVAEPSERASAGNPWRWARRAVPRTRATNRAAPAMSVSGSMIRNSSPPTLATRSEVRASSRRRRAVARMISSPAACPSRSFVAFRLSRSALMMETGLGFRCRRASSMATISFQAVRFSMPVSVSSRASRANRSRSAVSSSLEIAWMRSDSAACASAFPI